MAAATAILTDLFIMFLLAKLAGELFERLNQPAVIGELLVGIAIGPHALGWVGVPPTGMVEALHGQELAQEAMQLTFEVLAELGVIILLFLVGLELQPKRLWELRRSVFGLGGAQVAGTALVLGLLGLAFGLTVPAALVAGIGLSLSSTAFALQLLSEKNELGTTYGRASFGILLFQDLAVIPLLAALLLVGAVLAGLLSSASAFLLSAATTAAGDLLDPLRSPAWQRGWSVLLGLAALALTLTDRVTFDRAVTAYTLCGVCLGPPLLLGLSRPLTPGVSVRARKPDTSELRPMPHLPSTA